MNSFQDDLIYRLDRIQRYLEAILLELRSMNPLPEAKLDEAKLDESRLG